MALYNIILYFIGFRCKRLLNLQPHEMSGYKNKSHPCYKVTKKCLQITLKPLKNNTGFKRTMYPITLGKTKITQRVIFLSECSYMKKGFHFLLCKRAEELGIDIQYIELEPEDAITNLIGYCRGHVQVTVLCDTRSRYFPYLFDMFRKFEKSAKSKTTAWITNLAPEITNKPERYNQSYANRLTALENQIVKLLMKAWRPKQISELIGIDVKRVSYYKRNAMRKMGVSTSHELFHKYYGSSKIRNIAILSNTVIDKFA